jgi:hypothetical protein
MVEYVDVVGARSGLSPVWQHTIIPHFCRRSAKRFLSGALAQRGRLTRPPDRLQSWYGITRSSAPATGGRDGRAARAPGPLARTGQAAAPDRDLGPRPLAAPLRHR